MNEIRPIEVRQPLVQPVKVREPSEAEKKLKLALKIGGMHHTYSMAQVVGIYPA